jgi:hypothetical protein
VLGSLLSAPGDIGVYVDGAEAAQRQAILPSDLGSTTANYIGNHNIMIPT